MKKEGKKLFVLGVVLLGAFVIWTLLIQKVDVQAIGVNGTNIGFARINSWFHKLTGVHMVIYNITDWLGLVPIFVCMIFGVVGIGELIKRRSIFKVDRDIIFLGGYYVLLIFGYLIFEMIPINYRPILIEGIMEASYPSSTTLLVLGVMPTLVEQSNRRLRNIKLNSIVKIFAVCFSVFMVVGRMVSGVHWITDIVGSLMLSGGLYYIYKAVVVLYSKNEVS